MVIFKNTLTTLLAEAEDDGGFGDPTADDQNENEETEGGEEPTEEETTEEDNKEETEQNDEDTEGQEEEGEDDFSDPDGDEENMGEGEDGETEDNGEEAPKEQDNPYRIKTYFDRLKGIRDQYSSFENIVRNNKELDITLDDSQINTLNLIFDEIDKAQEQLSYLIVRGKILSLSTDKVANVYNKLQSKLLHLIGLYEDMINKNL